MNADPRLAAEERILILAPTGRDGPLASEMLGKGGFLTKVCPDIDALCAALSEGAGAVLLAEEVLSPRAERLLAEALQRQPPWSDLPVLIFATALPSRDSAARLQRQVEVLGNVTLVERPTRVFMLVTQLNAALRARRRQYLARETLAALHAQEGEARRRADFEQHLIGIVSHDLRNPLQAILLGTGVLLRRGELADAALKAVTRIQTAANRAERMIRDLLDFTRARLSGSLQVTPVPIDLHETVRQAMAELELAHPERTLVMRCEGDGRGEWDADRIAQVVTNLVSNAIRYGDPGTPVTARVRDDDKGVAIEIHNRGPVISEKLLPRLFEPLQRGDARSAGGGRNIGLGLFIVRQVVQAHRGAIEVDSSERGTTFRVRLPRQP